MSAQDHLNPKQFFHGTNVELKPGEYVLPPEKTGAQPHSHPDIPAEEFNNAAHVYVSTSLQAAQNFASDKGGSNVYEVEPHSDIHKDPESEYTGDEDSYRASKARVIRKV